MKLAYKIYGSGQPVIIMHGLFGSGDNWRTIARMMEDQYQCIVVDMRNHGRSPHDPVMNFQVMTEDIIELMQDLQLEKVSMVGHSMGGKVAMQFALQHPDLVDKLIVVDIAPKYYPPHHDVVIEAIEAIDPSLLKERSEAEGVFMRFLGNDESTIQFLMKNLTRLPEGGFTWKPNMPVIIEAYYHLMEDVQHASSFEGPSLFVRGQKSRYIADEDVTRIKEFFPTFSLVTIADAGHWVHADAPQEFAKIILNFLND
jgi:pimeloyl-ACP methyl ester carboxylesterase